MPRDATMSWLVQHHKANPTHVVRETVELPPHCVTCGDKDKSPMYELEVIAFEERQDQLAGDHYESAITGRCICGQEWVCLTWVEGLTANG